MLANKEKARHRHLGLLSHRSCDRRLPNASQPINQIDRRGLIRDRSLQPIHDIAEYLHPSSFKAAGGSTKTIRIVACTRGTRKSMTEELSLCYLDYRCVIFYPS